MKRLPAFAVNNPVLVHLATLLVVVGGVSAYRALPREAFQNTSVDMVQIRTVYRGASPEEVEKLITIPLEDEVAEVDRIVSIQSFSQEGISSIIVEFEVGVKDMYRRVQEIQAQVDQVRTLPADAEMPEVIELEVRFPLVTVALGGGASERQLQDAAEILEAEFSTIPGVDEIEVAGVRDREIWVEVDPGRLEAYGLTLADVRNAVRAKNRNVVGGKFTVGEREFLVRTMGEVEAIRDLGEVVVRSTPDGGQVVLRDVATIADTFEEALTLGRVDGHRAVTLTVNKAPGGDTIDIVTAVRAVVAQFEPGFPPGLTVDLYGDEAKFVARRFLTMEHNSIVGFALVIAILYLFIGFRAALMTALGIPIAFLGAIVLMHAFGLTFNLLSIFGLVMVLGMIVDDAIIVCENVYRHMEDGEAPARAAVRGTQEVMVPVAASVITTIAAFLPLLVFSGVMGKFFSVIPKVVIFALMASLIECFTVLPSHLAEFARPQPGRRSRRDAPWFRLLEGTYTGLLRNAVRFRYATLLCFMLGTAGLMIWAQRSHALRFQLFPQEDIAWFDVRLELPVGLPLDRTENALAAAEAVTNAHTTPGEVEIHYGTVGLAPAESQRGVDRGSHLGFLRIDLTDWDDGLRDRTGDAILADLRAQLATLVEPESISFQRETHGPPVGRPIQVRIRGRDHAMLQMIAGEIMEHLRGMDGVVDVKAEMTLGKEEIRVHVDEARAALYGLNVAAVADVVRTAIDGGVAGTWFDHGEELDVVVKYQAAYQVGLDDIEDMKIPAPTGALVPFKSVASLERTRGVSTVNRYARERVLRVFANVVKDRKDVTSKSVTEALAAEFADYAQRWPGYALAFGGEYEKTNESLIDLQRQFGMAILLIYVILGATFRSFVQPLVVMFTVPFAFVGVVYGLIISNQALGMMSFIGVIALAGIVVNDSIVLVTYINRRRVAGAPAVEAVVEGGRIRMRPIILTSVTTIFGLLPLAGQWFGHEPLLTSMAIAIVWGLTFSTLLTLIVIPAVYLIVDDAERLATQLPQRLRRRWQHGRAVATNGQPQDQGNGAPGAVLGDDSRESVVTSSTERD